MAEVDLSSADAFIDRPNDDVAAAAAAAADDDDDSSMTSLTRRGERLTVFLQRRAPYTAVSAHRDVTSAGRRRRRRSVNVRYRVFASPAAVTESVRKTVEKYSRRRNGEYASMYCLESVVKTRSYSAIGSANDEIRSALKCNQ